MLIRSIRAENFMRFEHVQVEELPERGLIGIEGPNESGKSTLGQLLLFAFFGRARLERDFPVAGLIRWGAESLHVEVEFSVASRGGDAGGETVAGGTPGGRIIGRDYMVYREIDRSGTNYVRVLRLPARETVAVGNIDVRKFMAREIRFCAEEFLESFYHGQFQQRRIENGSLRSDQVGFFERATGIAHLRAAIEKTREKILTREESFAHVQKELGHNRAQIERYDRNVHKIPALSEKLTALKSQIADRESVAHQGRREVSDLRAEAKRIERRASELKDALNGTVVELREKLEKALEAERAADRQKGWIHREPAWEKAFREPRDLLVRIGEFAGEFLALQGEIKERSAEVLELLEPENTEGMSGDYKKRENGKAKLQRGLRRMRVVSSLLFLLTVAAAGASIVVWQGAFVEPDLYRTAIGVAGGMTAVLLFLWAWSFAQTGATKRRYEESGAALEALRGQLDDLRKGHESLTGLVTVRVTDAVSCAECARESLDERIRKKAEKFFERQTGFLESDGEPGLETALATVHKLDRELKGKLFDAANKAKRKHAESDGALKKLANDHERVEGELGECRSQETKKSAFEEKNLTIETEAGSVSAEIAVHRQAIALIEGTITSVRSKVRPAITAYLKTVLPRLTADRYRDLKVEENLEIRVFSSAKSDFLVLSELSGGTSEALDLALRLAVSQTFATARVGQSQFVFLDEPFKMMDAERSVATLSALRELSPDLQQIFVAQPNFGDAERELFAYLIRTDCGTSRVQAGPRSTAGPLTAALAEAREDEVDRARGFYPDDRASAEATARTLPVVHAPREERDTADAADEPNGNAPGPGRDPRSERESQDAPK